MKGESRIFVSFSILKICYTTKKLRQGYILFTAYIYIRICYILIIFLSEKSLMSTTSLNEIYSKRWVIFYLDRYIINFVKFFYVSSIDYTHLIICLMYIILIFHECKSQSHSINLKQYKIKFKNINILRIIESF